jgi:HEAT repeat protein
MADEAASQTLSQLLGQLKSPAWDARIEAVQKLRDRSESSALEGLVSVLYDEDTAVVEVAAKAMLGRGDEAVFEPLLRALNAAEPDLDVAEEVQSVLAHNPEPWFVQRCIAALRESDDDELRAFAAEALGYPLHATNAIDVLEQALSDPSADVREAAAHSLLRLRASKTDVPPC